MTTAEDDPDREHESEAAEAPAPEAETPTRLQQAGAAMAEAQAWKGQAIATGFRKFVRALRRREEGGGLAPLRESALSLASPDLPLGMLNSAVLVLPGTLAGAGRWQMQSLMLRRFANPGGGGLCLTPRSRSGWPSGG